MEKNFRMLYDDDIVNSVKDMIMQVSTFKMYVFRSLLSGEAVITPGSSAKFLSVINGYLQRWEEFADDMQEKIKNTKETGNARSIGYDSVKDYIYDKYDYKAITLFADGILRGIGDGNIKSKSGIESFFKSTARQAFGGGSHPDSTAALLDSVLVSKSMYDNKPNDYDRKMFNAITHKTDIFGRTDRADIYNNIKEVTNFLSDTAMVKKKLMTGPAMALAVASINAIVEFMTYALAIYAVRIYAINLFAYPFINSSITIDNADSIHESVVTLPHTAESEEKSEIRIMHNANEAECKDYDVLFRTFMDAVTELGASGFIPDFEAKKKYRCFNMNDMKNNSFASKLLTNDLYSFISDPNGNYRYPNDSVRRLQEVNLILKSIVSPRTSMNGTASSPKNEFMAIVRSIDCGNTAKDYQKLFADLTVLALFIGSTLDDIIRSSTNITVDMLNSRHVPLSSSAIASENMKLAQDLMSDLVFLFIQKGRDIETKFNKVNTVDINKKVGLDIPKAAPAEYGTTSDITSAVPDTLAVPVDISDLYQLPAFEYYQFYDEAVKSVYDLADDWYYSEAFNVSTITNKIKSLLQSIGSKIKSWWDNGQRQKAVNWAITNGDAVAKKDFTNKTMEVLPFKNNGSSEDIALGAIMSKMIDGLKNFKIDMMNSPEEMDKFIKSLYPDDDIYGWFAKEGQQGEAAAKFHSYVLFRDKNNVSTKPEPVIKISGNEINKRCTWWVNTCKNAKSMHDELVNINNQIIKVIDDTVKEVSKLDANQGEQKSEALSSASTTAGSNGSPNNETKQLPATAGSNNNQATNTNAKAANAEKLLNELNSVFLRVYRPLIDICTQYTDAEYRYLQTAYSLGENPKQQ